MDELAQAIPCLPLKGLAVGDLRMLPDEGNWQRQLISGRRRREYARWSRLDTYKIPVNAAGLLRLRGIPCISGWAAV